MRVPSVALLLLGSSLVGLFIFAPAAHAQSGPSVSISTPNATPGSIVSVSGTGFSSQDHYVNVSVLQGLTVWYFIGVTGTDCSNSAQGYAPPSGTYICPANGVVETGGSVPAGDCPVTNGAFDCLFIVPALPKYASPCSDAGSCAGDELGTLFVAGDSNDHASTAFSVLDGVGLVPNEGPPGTPVTVYGDGWIGCIVTKYGGVCDLTANYNWDGQYLLMDAILFRFNTQCLPDPSGDVGQAGSGACTFIVPENSTGIHTLTVSATLPFGIPDKSQSADFLIAPPQISASVSGSQFEISGFGFSTSDSYVGVTVDQPGSGDVYNLFKTLSCPASAGAIACSIDAGETPQPGPYFVSAQGPSDLSPATTVLSVPGQYPLSFDPAAVFPGQTVRVTGYGYQYEDTGVSVSYASGSVQETEPCPASQGIFSCLLTISPSVQLGSPLTIFARGNFAGDTQSGTLSIYPIISTNPLSGPPGTTIRVNGTGFSNLDTRVDISLSGQVIGSCSTVAVVNDVIEVTGRFTSCPLTIPPLPPGTYDLMATGNNAKDNATSLLFVGGATVSPDVVFANNPPPTVTVTGANIGFTQYGPTGLQFVSDGVAELTDPGILVFCPVADGSFSCQFPTAYALTGHSIGVIGWALYPGSGCPIPGYSNFECVQELIPYSASLDVYDLAAVSLACTPDPALATQGAQTMCTATVTDTAHGGTPPGDVTWTYSGPTGGQLSASSCTLVELPPPSDEPSAIMPSACSVKLTLPEATGMIEINATYSGARGSVNYNPATGDVVLLPLTLQSSGVGSDATAPVLSIGGTGYSASQLPITIWGTYGENPVAYEATIPAGTGKQYAFSSYTGCGGSQLAPPLTITDQCSTVIGNYVTQYYFTTAQDSSAVSPDYSQLVSTLSSTSPANGWYDAGTLMSAADSYYPIGEAFGVQDVVSSFTGTGSAAPGGSCQVPSVISGFRSTCSVLFVIDSPTSITWTWAQQYQVNFGTEGIGSDTGSATVLTLNGTAYPESQLPSSGLFLSGTSLSYSYAPVVQGTSGDQYAWTGTSGLGASSLSGILTVTGPGSVDANYKTQYLQSFSANGLNTDATGPLLQVTVANGQPGGTQTFNAPAGGTFYADAGATVTYSYQPLVGSSLPGVRYSFTSVSGLPSGYTVSSPNAIAGAYVTQYLVGFDSSGIGTDSGSNVVVTVAGTAYQESQLPFTDWYDAGSSVSYSFSSPVSAGIEQQYVWTGTSGLGQTLQSGTLTPSSAGTVTGAYKAQYLQTFAASGLGPDAVGALVSITVSGGAPAGTQTFNAPAGGSLFVDQGASVVYTFDSPVASSITGQQYRLTGVGGQSSGYAVSSANTITGAYIVQYLLTVAMAPSGLSPSPTIAPTSPTGYYDAGTPVSLTANNVSGYVFVNWVVDGVNQTQLVSGVTVTMDGPHAATAAYQAPVNAIQTLIHAKDAMNLPQGIATSLDAKLNAALNSLNSGQNNVAVNQLNAFINEVNAQTGKDISQSQAQLLVSFAQGIINAVDSS